MRLVLTLRQRESGILAGLCGAGHDQSLPAARGRSMGQHAPWLLALLLEYGFGSDALEDAFGPMNAVTAALHILTTIMT